VYVILFCFYCEFWTNSPNLISHAVYHSVLYNSILSSLNTITAGPPVNKFWCVLKLRLQYAVCGYGISYRHWISSRGWPIWCGLLSRSLGESIIAHCEHQRITSLCTGQLNCTNYLKMCAMKNNIEIWKLEDQSLYVRFTESGWRRIKKCKLYLLGHRRWNEEKVSLNEEKILYLSQKRTWKPSIRSRVPYIRKSYQFLGA
jgi:hypothetical protein